MMKDKLMASSAYAHLKLIEIVTQENVTIALKQSIDTRSHHFSRAGFDPS